VATDGAIAAFGRDVRRLRPNILIGGVEGLAERDWSGAELHIGGLIVRLDSLRARCAVTTVDPDTLERDPEVLRDIGRRFRGRMALNADVARPGAIAIGDPVRLVRPHESPGSVMRCISPGARRPAGKARRPSILGICEGEATPPAGMPRPGIM